MFLAQGLKLPASPLSRQAAVGLASLQGIHDTQWSLIMAGATLALVPVVAVFLLAQ